MNNRYEGVFGEESAIEYLKKSGYRIIEKNYTTAHGELDIIALDGDTIVFIEVKSRNNEKYGKPIEAITRKKQDNIIKSAKEFIHKKRLYERNIRFDAICILRDNMEHIENVFWSN